MLRNHVIGKATCVIWNIIDDQCTRVLGIMVRTFLALWSHKCWGPLIHTAPGHLVSGQFLEEFRLHLCEAMIPLDSAREKGLLITVACVRSLIFVSDPVLYAK